MKGKHRLAAIEKKQERKGGKNYVSPYGRKVMERRAELAEESKVAS